MAKGPNAAPPEAVVFDWNGTLSDMGVLLAQNKHVGRVEFGLELTDDDIRNCWGATRYNFYDQLYGTRIGNRLTAQQIRERFMAHNHGFPRRIHPDVSPTFDALEAAGVARGLITTGPRAEIEQFAREAGFDTSRFDFMAMQDEEPSGEPALLPAVRHLGRLGIQVHRAVFVGDEENTRTQAEEVGMDYVVVANGTRSKATLLERNVPSHKIINRLSELAGILGITAPNP